MEESVESVGGGSLGSMATDLSYNLEEDIGGRRGRRDRGRGGGGGERKR